MRYNIKNLMVFLFFCIFLSTKNVLASGSSEFKTYSTLGNSKAMGMNASIKFPASWKSKHVSPISSIVLHYGDDASSSCSLSIKQSSVDANAKLPYLSKSDFEFTNVQNPLFFMTQRVNDFKKVNFGGEKLGLYISTTKLQMLNVNQFADITAGIDVDSHIKESVAKKHRNTITIADELYFPFKDKLVYVSCNYILPSTVSLQNIQDESSKFANNQHKVFMQVLNSLVVQR